MPRYFVEVAYLGTNYSGFQTQENADTIQDRVQVALQTIYRTPFDLTGSSRTDAGVHAKQNYFHVDTDVNIESSKLYNINAVLPNDIVVNKIIETEPDLHARFSATARTYNYSIHTQKDPFLNQTSWFYPYAIDFDLLTQAASKVLANQNFEAFAKRNSQVYTHECTILESRWIDNGHTFIYQVKANRFLRGMVRALVATMLKVARKSISIDEFELMLSNSNTISADFSAPAHGLTLIKVDFPKIIIST